MLDPEKNALSQDLTLCIMVYMNGCSGRYAARTARQLDDAVAVIRGFGYNVRCAGWDADANRPGMVFRDDD